MKKFKIPSPKLNNPTLCLLFFYAGAVLFLPLLALSPAVAALFGDTASVIYAIVILILLSANILANSYYFESTSNFLASVTAWKCARLWFETDVNGKTRAEAEKLISARITAKGTAHTPVNGYFSPLCVQYVSDGRKNFINKAFFPTHKLCLLYSVAIRGQKLPFPLWVAHTHLHYGPKSLLPAQNNTLLKKCLLLSCLKVLTFLL